jgi:chromosome segregation ATPase
MAAHAVRLQKLSEKAEEVEKRLDAIGKQLPEARRRFEEDESTALIEDRAPDPKLKKKIIELEASAADLTAKRIAIRRTIAEINEREVTERSQMEYERREAFRKTAQPQIARLMAATFEMRNSVEAFFDAYSKESLGLVDLAGFLFPIQDPQHPIDDMPRRMNQIGMMTEAVAWIQDDLMHSRSGPQKPERTEVKKS